MSRALSTMDGGSVMGNPQNGEDSVLNLHVCVLNLHVLQLDPTRTRWGAFREWHLANVRIPLEA
jgi:hypothetical protein